MKGNKQTRPALCFAFYKILRMKINDGSIGNKKSPRGKEEKGM
jgi:hypothetical protein